jgi:uncharacterized protein
VARPAKPRFVTGEPCVDFFKPRGIPMSELKEEYLTVEELEAIKLIDIDGLYQEDAAERMEVSRQTFQRVLKSARGKVARCLVEGKALGIEGGNYMLSDENRVFECLSCGSTWDAPYGSGVRACETACPRCGEMSVRRACAGGPRSRQGHGPGRRCREGGSGRARKSGAGVKP